MRTTRDVVFLGTLLACGLVTFVWTQRVLKRNDEPPIVLGTLPDLPPIVLPSMHAYAPATPSPSPLAERKSSPQSSSSSPESCFAEDDPHRNDLHQAATNKIDRLTFDTTTTNTTTTKPRPILGHHDMDVRDIPMFTPRDSLLTKP